MFIDACSKGDCAKIGLVQGSQNSDDVLHAVESYFSERRAERIDTMLP